MKTTATHVYFWGGIYSQWYKRDFVYKGFTFSTAEQWMMFNKAMLFNDKSIAKEILETKDPKKQKALGRKVKNFDECVWDRHKLKIVIKGNYLKFSQNKDLKDKLMATGDKKLVEGSPYDAVWGVSLKFDDPRILDEKNWKGQNLLGIALMEVREKFK